MYCSASSCVTGSFSSAAFKCLFTPLLLLWTEDWIRSWLLGIALCVKLHNHILRMKRHTMKALLKAQPPKNFLLCSFNLFVKLFTWRCLLPFLQAWDDLRSFLGILESIQQRSASHPFTWKATFLVLVWRIEQHSIQHCMSGCQKSLREPFHIHRWSAWSFKSTNINKKYQQMSTNWKPF